MIDFSLLCQKQRKKIVACIFIIVVGIFGDLFTHFTFVGRNIYLKSVIVEKKEQIDTKRKKMDSINNVLKRIKKEKTNWNLGRKSGFYDNFNKSDFVIDLKSKINGDDDLEEMDGKNNAKSKYEYADLDIKLNSYAEGELYNKVRKKVSTFKIIKEQGIDIVFDENILTISFKADYEYVAYRLLNIIKDSLPGYAVLKSLSIRPVVEETKQFLYNRKFHKFDGEPSMDNRLTCEIELLWFFLRSPFTQKMIDNEKV